MLRVEVKPWSGLTTGRATALVALLLLPAFARADAAPFPLPSGNTVPTVYRFVTEQNHPGWEFWLVRDNAVAERLLVAPGSPTCVSAKGAKQVPHAAVLYAVSKRRLDAFEGQPPPREWLTRQSELESDVIRLTWLRFSERLSFNDNRKQVEVTHHIGTGPNGPRLESTSENSGDPMYRWTRGVSFCILLPLGITAFTIWGVWRVVRWLRVADEHQKSLRGQEGTTP